MPTPSLARFCLVIHYDGSPFHGWQLQKKQRTVQGCLEAVLERVTGTHRTVVGSGRTDSGVHALGQVASVDLPDARWRSRELRRALNALLPAEVWIESIRRVPRDFHPRYDARRRTYLYRLGTVHGAGSPFHARWCWNVTGTPPDSDLLAKAAALLPGDRSFGSFAKAGQPHRGTRCRVAVARWRPWGDLGLEFEISANRFLHHMVRYLVGTMMDVALGRRTLDELEGLLTEPATELITSAPAPPEGLFLYRVEYETALATYQDDLDPEPA